MQKRKREEDEALGGSEGGRNDQVRFQHRVNGRSGAEEASSRKEELHLSETNEKKMHPTHPHARAHTFTQTLARTHPHTHTPTPTELTLKKKTTAENYYR